MLFYHLYEWSTCIYFYSSLFMFIDFTFNNNNNNNNSNNNNVPLNSLVYICYTVALSGYHSDFSSCSQVCEQLPPLTCVIKLNYSIKNLWIIDLSLLCFANKKYLKKSDSCTYLHVSVISGPDYFSSPCTHLFHVSSQSTTWICLMIGTVVMVSSDSLVKSASHVSGLLKTLCSGRKLIVFFHICPQGGVK